jgi:hypothetical protein
MQGRWPGPAAALVLLCVGCRNEPEPPAPLAAADVTAPASAPVAAAPIEPAAKPPAPAPASVWLTISRGGVELAILELTPGRPSALTLAKKDAPSRELKKKWDKLDRAGTSAPDTVRQALEAAEYYVEEVPRLDGPVLVHELRKLNVVRNGEPVGSLDFSTDPPTLSIETTTSDGSLLKSHWDAIATREQLEVRFHQARDGVEKFFTLAAKPGEPNYPNLVRLYLMLRHQYDEEHGYALSTLP